MRLISLAWTVAMAASTMGAAAQSPMASQATLPEPITTRQTLFSIPFHIDRAENPMHDPTLGDSSASKGSKQATLLWKQHIRGMVESRYQGSN